MTLCFTLSMPGRASWNGRWSGENKLFAITRGVCKSDRARAFEMLAKRSYHYNWSDGWGARIDVSEVTARDAVKIRRKSQGFCGYEWMVDSLFKWGEIYASHEEPELQV